MIAHEPDNLSLVSPDNHQGAWSPGAIAEFTAGTKMPLAVRVMDVGPSAPRNAWIADVRPVGHRIDRADPATWKSLATLEKVPVTRTETVDLWNRFACIVLLVILLGADWLLRLLRGFA